MKRLYEFTVKKKESVDKEVQDVNKAGEEITANYNLYTYPKTGIGLQTF